MAESGTSRGGFSALGEAAARWGSGLAVVLALLYAAGFVVVNTYLGFFGVRDLEPLRTRYVAAAIPFVLLAMLAAFVGVRIDDAFVRLEGGRTRLHRAMLVVARLPVVAVVVTVLILSVVGSLRLGGGGAPFQWSLLRLVDVILFGLGAVLAVIVFRHRRHDWRTPLGGLVALSSLSSFAFALFGYANTVYPAIPPSFGGGAPDEVQLVLDDIDTACPVCGTGTVRLLDEDSNRVVVLIERTDGTRVAVEIPRPAVRSIIHRAVPAR